MEKEKNQELGDKALESITGGAWNSIAEEQETGLTETAEELRKKLDVQTDLNSKDPMETLTIRRMQSTFTR